MDEYFKGFLVKVINDLGKECMNKQINSVQDPEGTVNCKPRRKIRNKKIKKIINLDENSATKKKIQQGNLKDRTIGNVKSNELNENSVETSLIASEK